MTGQEQRWPLEGVRVLDLGQLYNGPYAGFLLAHAGADVVKVEPPGGEALRDRGGGQPSMALAMLNTRKRGITINLKSERGRALLFDLARQADVFLENFAPGTLARLGVRAEDLMAANPRLIYASGTGYGLSGPSRDNLAMDLTVQAVGGVMSINGTEDGPPLKAGLAICDFLGAVHLYSGIMTALYERSVTGRGRFVEVAMQEALYPALASNIAGLYRNGWKQPPRRGNKHPNRGSSPYNVYACRDGHVAIISVREVHWTNLLKLMGREDLLNEPRFETQSLRAQHEDEIDALVEAWTSRHGRDEAVDLLREHRIPAAPVRNLEEVTADRHMHERGMLHDVDDPILGRIVLNTSPLRFAGTPPPEIGDWPDVGEHQVEVLHDWLGLDEAAMKELERDGAFE